MSEKLICGYTGDHDESHVNCKRGARIKELEEALNESLTIAHMDGVERGKDLIRKERDEYKEALYDLRAWFARMRIDPKSSLASYRDMVQEALNKYKDNPKNGGDNVETAQV